MPHTNAKLLVIGGGNMGQAILNGAFRAGLLEPEEAAVVDTSPQQRAALAALGVRAAESPVAVADSLAPDAPVLLAVKPQMLADAARDLGPIARGRLVVSILAGATRDAVRAALGGEAARVRVVRAMPNTPARVGKGLTAIARSEGGPAADVAFARRLFESVGGVVEIDEGLIDAFTAVVGSGPAYIFRLTEALERAACSVGFDEVVARRLAREMVVGAAALLDGTDESAATLRERVTSKGGTTAAGLAELEAGDLDELVARVVTAARDRGRELAEMASTR